MILELKTTESKLISDLENSNQKLKECNGKLKVQLEKNRQCESDKKICEGETVSKDKRILELESKKSKITSELENESAKYIIAKQELRGCKEKLEKVTYCNCKIGSHCVNTKGSYECVDIDECANGTHKCDQNAQCNNANGGYMCTCNSGYTGKTIKEFYIFLIFRFRRWSNLY